MPGSSLIADALAAIRSDALLTAATVFAVLIPPIAAVGVYRLCAPTRQAIRALLSALALLAASVVVGPAIWQAWQVRHFWGQPLSMWTPVSMAIYAAFACVAAGVIAVPVTVAVVVIFWVRRRDLPSATVLGRAYGAAACILAVPLLSACLAFAVGTATNGVMGGRMASFPPESSPFESGWQYVCNVEINARNSDQRNRKVIYVSVQDTSGRGLLRDELAFESVSLETTITWQRFETLQVDLFEVGDEAADDAYNRSLIKSGPRKLESITYRYDRSARRFVRGVPNNGVQQTPAALR